jgi:hypothetical protein
MDCSKYFAIVAIYALSTVAHADVNALAPEELERLTQRCQDFAKVDLSRTVDAPTKLTDAKLLGVEDIDRPIHCQLTGYVAPNVGIVIRLPLLNWNGKYIQMGCGGSCGTITGVGASSGDYTQCLASVRKGYACLLSDNGHTGTGNLWAYHNLQAELDHAFRATHVAAVAGKAITTRFFEREPRLSYFWGCSTGGRQALTEAQLFPYDFDGIIAGCPSINYPLIALTHLWNNRALTDPRGELLLSQEDLEFLHQSVVAACDMNDGVKDGLIGDPRQCTFDPAKLRCKPGANTRCLSADQVAGIQRLYSGPQTSTGERIYFPSAMRGSEKTWATWFKNVSYSADVIRYMGFTPAVGPTWNPQDFDFDRDYQRLGAALAIHAGANPDLRRFNEAGGKLLSFVGWNDAGGMPLAMVDYYESVERLMGGRTPTQSFFRFFAVPGMDHCGGGDGAFAIDWLGTLEQWVEQGRAPDKLFAAHVPPENPQDVYEIKRLEYPVAPSRINFSRPVYPYPVTTKYAGRGDVTNAGNFRPAR